MRKDDVRVFAFEAMWAGISINTVNNLDAISRLAVPHVSLSLCLFHLSLPRLTLFLGSVREYIIKTEHKIGSSEEICFHMQCKLCLLLQFKFALNLFLYLKVVFYVL
jgi:hypothetical protein